MRSGLALRGIAGNITTARTSALWASTETRTAWFVLAPARLSFRSEAEVRSIILSGAQRYAELGVRRYHLRTPTRPYDVDEWGRRLDANTPDPLPGWAKHLRAEARHMLGLVLSDKLVYIGVDLRDGDPEDLTVVTAAMGGPGLDGKPTTAAETEWLVHRSVGLGLPAQVTMPASNGPLDEADIGELTDYVDWTDTPYGRSVRVDAEVNGDMVTRYVVVLTVGRMAELDIPNGGEPWLQRVDRLAFPVDIAATVDVEPTEQTQRFLSRQLVRIRDQVEHYLEHDLDAPAALSRQRVAAIEVQDEVAQGFTGLAQRTTGWYRMAVSGATEREALDRARQVIELHSPSITITRPSDQYRMAREFIPGEPVANTAYARHMPIVTWAGAVPAATALVGDRDGIYLGTTCGSSERAVLWEPWRSMEVGERSGLTIMAGGLGAGKSTLLWTVVYETVMRGVRWSVWDPSGPLGRMCELPELRDYSRLIDLLHAEPGTLNPYRVVADPARDNYGSDDEWERARKMAASQRRTLCYDTLSLMLPGAMALDGEVTRVLRRAVREAGSSYTASPWAVIERLDAVTDGYAMHARDVAAELREVAEMPQAQLIFPAGYQLDYDQHADPRADLLTVYTMRGLVTPTTGSDRREWMTDERFGLVAMTLGATLTSRSIYGRPMDERKGLAVDEAHALSAIPSGRVLLTTTARDTRKHNLRAILSSQNVADLDAAGVGNFVDNSFVGRTTDPAAQTAAVRLQGVPEGVGYEAVYGNLSAPDRRAVHRSGTREFVWADGTGGIEKFRPDISGRGAVAERMDTTADPSKLRVVA